MLKNLLLTLLILAVMVFWVTYLKKPNKAANPDGSREGTGVVPDCGFRIPKNLYIIFDPTIFESSEEERIEALLGSMEHFYASLPPNISVWVLVTNSASNYAPFVSMGEFNVNSSAGWQENLRDSLKKDYPRLKTYLLSEWQRMHSARYSNTAESCIVSGIYALSEKIGHSLNTTVTQDYALVISDFLEVCGEGDSAVNFELMVDNATLPDSLSNVPSFMVSMNLSGLDKVSIVHIPERRVQPAAHEHLKELWDEAFAGWGVQNSASERRREVFPPKTIFRFWMDYESAQVVAP